MRKPKIKTFRISGTLSIRVHGSIDHQVEWYGKEDNVSDMDAQSILLDALVDKIQSGDYDADENDVDLDDIRPVRTPKKAKDSAP